MDLPWILVCVSVLLSVCVRSERSKMDAGRDQANRIRHMWLLSIKESQTRQKDANSSVGKINTYQLLYCRVGIGYHLQIQPSGSVRGVHTPTKHSWLKVFAVKPGVVGIRGVKSRLYLCMNKEGITQGMAYTWPCPNKDTSGEVTWCVHTMPAVTSCLAKSK